jgi:8-oxo-dGTP pyrophosphatase MutT (NUDIX family)
VREVDEELGRLIKVTGRIGEAVEFFYSSDDECWYEMIATFFRAEFEGSPLKKGEDELCWVDSREQPKLFFHACHAWAAAQA